MSCYAISGVLKATETSPDGYENSACYYNIPQTFTIKTLTRERYLEPQTNKQTRPSPQGHVVLTRFVLMTFCLFVVLPADDAMCSFC